MYKNIFLLILISILTCCHTSEYKVCDFNSNDVKLKIYNDVLNELIVHRFYGGYLGADGDSIYNKYVQNIDDPDTAKINSEVISLYNKIFNDTLRFRTLCYSTCLRSGPWTYSMSSDYDRQYDSVNVKLTLKQMEFSENWKAVADALAQAQTEYAYNDFHLCTAKLIDGEHFYDGDIGVVSFSKIFVNAAETTGLLYYEFRCGGMCGRGEIILVELLDGRWIIKNGTLQWIS